MQHVDDSFIIRSNNSKPKISYNSNVLSKCKLRDVGGVPLSIIPPSANLVTTSNNLMGVEKILRATSNDT